MVEKIAFIGLGAMGFAMASNVRKKTDPSTVLVVYDISRHNCERFLAANNLHGPIEIASSAKTAAEGAAAVISIVPTADNVREVYLDNLDGVLAAGRNPQRLIIECSTIDAQSAREIGQALEDAQRGRYIDCPVSGGVPAATTGTLSFLIGHPAPESTDEPSTLRNILETMGCPEKFFYCGQRGAGLAAKIANNYLSCSIMLANAEAMAIGVRSGIDKNLLHRVIHHSTGQSFMMDHVQPVPGVVPHAPSSNGYALGFKTQMMVKDLRLGVEAGQAVGIEPTMAKTAMEVYERAAIDPRCIDRDGSSVYLHITGDEV